jgi:hypothetical protein
VNKNLMDFTAWGLGIGFVNGLLLSQPLAILPIRHTNQLLVKKTNLKSSKLNYFISSKCQFKISRLVFSPTTGRKFTNGFWS